MTSHADIPGIPHLRIARPVKNLAQTLEQYRSGLGLSELYAFNDHAGFSGIMLGFPCAGWHFEFTTCFHHPVEPINTLENLIVLYYPDEKEWAKRCKRMTEAGWEVMSFNPYWEKRGEGEDME
jgi:hypothetical protein